MRDDLLAFLVNNVEPLPANPPHGAVYRASVTLKDGLKLPCVAFESASVAADLAIKRFDETRGNNALGPGMDYNAIVRSFVTKGNTVNDYDISEIALSPFAIPLERLREIRGETSMSWTEFYAVMQDGAEFRFGTNYLTEFFCMPDGYTAKEIQTITPAIRGEKPRHESIYRERPFFTCYTEGI
jgi:hypothetical protein